MGIWHYVLVLVCCVYTVTCNATYNVKSAKKTDRGIKSGKNQIEAPECSLRRDRGDCNKKMKKFYFDASVGACREFNYTGCGGNLNNFRQLDQCNSRCICSSPKDSGQGPKRMTFYFFNTETENCQSFKYRGSGGNANRFFSLEQCQSVCERVTIRQKCQVRPDVGTNCNNNGTIKFYYDKHCDCCRQFRYLGCGGNDNTFSTRKRCLVKCKLGDPAKTVRPKQSQKPALCFYQNVYGNCNERHTRYFYNHQLDKCVPFTYSGCGGNENNFLTPILCKKTCKHDSTFSGLFNTIQH